MPADTKRQYSWSRWNRVLRPRRPTLTPPGSQYFVHHWIPLSSPAAARGQYSASADRRQKGQKLRLPERAEMSYLPFKSVAGMVVVWSPLEYPVLQSRNSESENRYRARQTLGPLDEMFRPCHHERACSTQWRS